MAPKRSNRASQGHEEPPRKRSRRLAGKKEENQGLTKSDFARKPPRPGSKAGSPKPSTHTAQKSTGSTAPSRQELIKRYTRLSLVDLQVLYGAFMNGEPPASKSALAEALADHRLIREEASSPEKPPTPPPQFPPPQAPSTPPTPPPPTSQRSPCHEAPSPAAPNSSPASQRPGQEWGSPDLTLNEINGPKTCEYFRQLVGFWQLLSTVEEVQAGQYLDDHQIHRAIMALTEVLGDCYSLITIANWDLAGHDGENAVTCQQNGMRFLRPQKPIIMPYTCNPDPSKPGQGHHFLIRVELENTPQHLPCISIYDSAEGYLSDRKPQIIEQIKKRIRRLQWSNWPGRAYPATRFSKPQDVPVPQQQNGRSCGLYAVINGWVSALGLRLVADKNFRPPKDFENTLRQLINLALEGQFCTRTIYTFLQCSRYIQRGDQLCPEFDVQLTRFVQDGREEKDVGVSVQNLYQALLHDEDRNKYKRDTTDAYPEDEEYAAKLHQKTSEKKAEQQSKETPAETTN